MFHIFAQIVIVLVLLVGMVVLLLSLHHLFRGDAESLEEQDVDKLRREVENGFEVISSHSLFHRFLVRQQKESRSRESRRVARQSKF